MLYLQPTRTAGVLSAQAEFQARILPALAEQTDDRNRPLRARPDPQAVNGHARSAP